MVIKSQCDDNNGPSCPMRRTTTCSTQQPIQHNHYHNLIKRAFLQQHFDLFFTGIKHNILTHLRHLNYDTNTQDQTLI